MHTSCTATLERLRWIRCARVKTASRTSHWSKYMVSFKACYKLRDGAVRCISLRPAFSKKTQLYAELLKAKLTGRAFSVISRRTNRSPMTMTTVRKAYTIRIIRKRYGRMVERYDHDRLPAPPLHAESRFSFASAGYSDLLSDKRRRLAGRDGAGAAESDGIGATYYMLRNLVVA